MRKIYLSPPHLSGNEMQYIQDAFDKNWVTSMGDNVTGFENDIKSFLKTNKGAIALSSGTAAIHLALILTGVKPGDVVICQDFTFVATATPILYLGAEPVFIDSEKYTWNMSPAHLEEAIIDLQSKGKKPKAIIYVNLYGMPANAEAIRQVADKYDIAVLEDAAESLGSSYKGQQCGTFGDYAVISFNGNKIITTSGGGMLLANKPEDIERARFLASQAKDPAPWYEHSELGYSYGLSNISAGIGRGQMQVLTNRIERRREINQYYRECLIDMEGISFHTEPNRDYFSNYWLTAILIDPQKNNGKTCNDLRIALNQANIEARFLWKPMHMQPLFKNCLFYGKGISEELFSKGLCLPSGSTLTNEDIERIVEVMKNE